MKRHSLWIVVFSCALGVVLPNAAFDRPAFLPGLLAIALLFPPMLMAQSRLRRDGGLLGYGRALLCTIPALILAASIHAVFWASARLGGGFAWLALLGGLCVALNAGVFRWAMRWYLPSQPSRPADPGGTGSALR